MMDYIVSYNIRVSDNIRTLAEEFSKELVNEINTQLKEKDKINIALSGGNTPNAIFKELAASYKEKLNWEKINLVWGDEG